MKHVHAFVLFFTVLALIMFTGCAGTNPQATTPLRVIETTVATLVPEPTLYPGTLALNEPAPFGIAGTNGIATVYKAETRSTYQWTSPSYNSPRDQMGTGDSLYLTQHGYITKKAKDGNTFLFVYVRLANTGTERLVVPSPHQFIIHSGGMTYPYSSVHGSDVTVRSVRVGQYDYQIGRGGVAGTIAPGPGNASDRFLI